MKKSLFILLPLLLFSCKDDTHEQELMDQIIELNQRIDSLKNVEPEPTEILPTGITILQVSPLMMARGESQSIEFRINPLEASLSLVDGKNVIELDCVREGSQQGATRLSVNISHNISLVSVEQVYDADTQQYKQGQYRATLSDCSQDLVYDETYSLLLTMNQGTADEYQISSSAFSVCSTLTSDIYTGLPIVMIETADAQPVLNRTDWMADTQMSIFTSEGELDYQGTLSIKGRGNTSWGFPKKPYALKLDKKAEILGMKKHKRWCLLANWADRSLIRNAVGFELARQTALDWTPSGQYVELILNGQHQGNYYLCEQIKIDENRVNVSDPDDVTTVDRGYLFELDTYFDETYKFYSPIRNLPWQFKDPDEVTPEQQAFIEQYVSDMESALYDPEAFARRDFANYMDLESFADYWFIYELAQCSEPNHPKSVYMHKDAGGKMVAGPVWDFDMDSFDPRYVYSYQIKESLYYDQLFLDKEFCQLVKDRWLAYRDHFLTVDAFIDSLYASLQSSDRVNSKMWPVYIADTDYTFHSAVRRMKQALREKIEWMDAHL